MLGLITLGYIERGETQHGEVMGHVVHRALVELQLRGSDIARPRDEHERGLAVRSGGLGIRARIKQSLDRFGIRVERRFQQRR